MWLFSATGMILTLSFLPGVTLFSHWHGSYTEYPPTVCEVIFSHGHDSHTTFLLCEAIFSHMYNANMKPLLCVAIFRH